MILALGFSKSSGSYFVSLNIMTMGCMSLLHGCYSVHAMLKVNNEVQGIR